MIKRQLEARLTDENGQLRVGAEWIIQSGIMRAVEGDIQWARFIFEYAYGRPHTVDTSDDRKSLEAEIIGKWLSTLPTEALVAIKRLTVQPISVIDVVETDPMSPGLRLDQKALESGDSNPGDDEK
jgi:hypothetical protein